MNTMKSLFRNVLVAAGLACAVRGVGVMGCSEEGNNAPIPQATVTESGPPGQEDTRSRHRDTEERDAAQPPDVSYRPHEGEPCNPELYVKQCWDDYLVYCPESRGITYLPINQIPENEYCVEGIIQKCTNAGWQRIVEADIQNKFKWEECTGKSEEYDAGMPQEDAGNESVPDMGRPEAVNPCGEGIEPGSYRCRGLLLEQCVEDGFQEIQDCRGGRCNAPEARCDFPPPCGEGVEQEAYRCNGTILQQCGPNGWQQIENCAGGQCRAEEMACYVQEEREVCDPMQEIVFTPQMYGNGLGTWRTTAQNFTCDPICMAPEGGSPVHQDRILPGGQTSTTATFGVNVQASKLYLSVSGAGNGQLHVDVDGIEAREWPQAGLCHEYEFVFDNLLRNNQSVTRDGQIDATVRTTFGDCHGYLPVRLGGINQPCSQVNVDDRRFCVGYIPYHMQATPCWKVEEWVRRQ